MTMAEHDKQASSPHGGRRGRSDDKQASSSHDGRQGRPDDKQASKPHDGQASRPQDSRQAGPHDRQLSGPGEKRHHRPQGIQHCGPVNSQQNRKGRQRNNEWYARFVRDSISHIRETVGDSKAIVGVSGGVDSTVATVLVHRAIGDKLIPVMIDHGLLREGEVELVVSAFSELGIHLRVVDAGARFLARLKGVADPEEKRKVIGEEFIRVLEDEAAKYGDVRFLVQGTILSDVVESGTSVELAVGDSASDIDEDIGVDIGEDTGAHRGKDVGKDAGEDAFEDADEDAGEDTGGDPGDGEDKTEDAGEDTRDAGTPQLVKSHHNVGGLPEHMDFELLEPLRELYKEQVRLVGEALGLPKSLIYRHPFPGPGLAVRVLGEVTKEKLDTLRKAQAVLDREILESGWYDNLWQYFCVLPNVRTVGVKDAKDLRTSDRRTGGLVL